MDDVLGLLLLLLLLFVAPVGESDAGVVEACWLLRFREDDLGDDAEWTLCTPRDDTVDRGLIIADAFGTAAGSGCNGGTLSLLLLLLLNDATALSL